MIRQISAGCMSQVVTRGWDRRPRAASRRADGPSCSPGWSAAWLSARWGTAVAVTPANLTGALFGQPTAHLIDRRAALSESSQPGLQVPAEPPRGNRRANAEEQDDGQRRCHDDQLLA